VALHAPFRELQLRLAFRAGALNPSPGS